MAIEVEINDFTDDGKPRLCFGSCPTEQRSYVINNVSVNFYWDSQQIISPLISIVDYDSFIGAEIGVTGLEFPDYESLSIDFTETSKDGTYLYFDFNLTNKQNSTRFFYSVYTNHTGGSCSSSDVWNYETSSWDEWFIGCAVESWVHGWQTQNLSKRIYINLSQHSNISNVDYQRMKIRLDDQARQNDSYLTLDTVPIWLNNTYLYIGNTSNNISFVHNPFNQSFFLNLTNLSLNQLNNSLNQQLYLWFNGSGKGTVRIDNFSFRYNNIAAISGGVPVTEAVESIIDLIKGGATFKQVALAWNPTAAVALQSKFRNILTVTDPSQLFTDLIDIIKLSVKYIFREPASIVPTTF